MPRRIYNEYDDMDMMEMQRRGGQGGSRGSQGGRGGRSGNQGGNRGGQGGRGARSAYNAYNAYPYMPPYSDYEEDDWDEDEEDEMDMYGAYNEMEMRRGVPGSGRGRSNRGRGRRRDSRGRFTSMMEEEMGYYPNGPYMGGKKQRIGFASPSMGGSMGAEFDEEELMAILEEIPDEIEPMDSKHWMSKLENEDGTKGEHWNREQTAKVYKEHRVDERTKNKVSEEDFHVTMNMLYSDYCKVFKENNINSIKVYVELACAWLMDKDAAENKLARYFYCVVDS